MTKPNSSKKKLVTLKIYFDRARMYLGYINFFILNMVLINSIENPVFKEYISDYKWFLIPVLFILYVVILLLIGYVDHKLGLRQEELKSLTSLNPVWQNLIKNIKEIQEKLTRIEENTERIDPTKQVFNKSTKNTTLKND